jgi:hypothetical protein
MMLVRTKFIRELMNNVRARSSVDGELMYYTTHNLVDGLEPASSEQKYLLGLNLVDFVEQVEYILYYYIMLL